jgi:hypothetical protein
MPNGRRGTAADFAIYPPWPRIICAVRKIIAQAFAWAIRRDFLLAGWRARSFLLSVQGNVQQEHIDARLSA